MHNLLLPHDNNLSSVGSLWMEVNNQEDSLWVPIPSQYSWDCANKL